MDPIYEIELQDCPYCRGTGTVEDEQGWCVYVTCVDCGAQTAHASYESPEERLAAAQQVAPDRLRRGIAVLPLVDALTGQCRAPLGDEFDDGLQIGLGCGENHHVPEYSFEGRN